MIDFNKNFFALPLIILSLSLEIPAHAQAPPSDTIQMTISQAIRRSIEQNPDFRELQARLDLQSAAVRITLAQILPVLSLNGTYTRYDQEVRLTNNSTDDSTDAPVIVQQNSLSGTGSASITLFRPSALGDYISSRRELEAVRADTERSEHTLAMAAVELCINIERTRALLEAAQASLDRREAFLRAAEQRLASELTDRSEVHRAQLSLLEARSALESATTQHLIAQASLAVMLNYPAETPIRITGDLEPPSETADESETRADIRATQLRLEAANAGRTWTWLTFLPELELSGGFTQGPETFRDTDGFSWQIQLQMTLVLYDGGARYGRLRQEAANQMLYQTQIEALEAEAELEIYSSEIRASELERQMETASESVEIATQYRDDVLQRLNAGAGTVLDVLDAEDQLTQTTTEQQTVRFDRALEEWRLLHARGQLGDVLLPSRE